MNLLKRTRIPIRPFNRRRLVNEIRFLRHADIDQGQGLDRQFVVRARGGGVDEGWCCRKVCAQVSREQLHHYQAILEGGWFEGLVCILDCEEEE
jgi:hypothetical protein